MAQQRRDLHVITGRTIRRRSNVASRHGKTSDGPEERGFDDPAHAVGGDEEKMQVFRRVRDEIRRVFEAYAAGRLDESKRRPS
jgi:hypothetical protein